MFKFTARLIGIAPPCEDSSVYLLTYTLQHAARIRPMRQDKPWRRLRALRIFAGEENLRTLERAVRKKLSLTDTAAMPGLGFDFVPLVVDTLGAPSGRIATTIKYYAPQISMPSASTTAIVANGN